MKYDVSRIIGLLLLVMVLTVFWQPLVWLMIIAMVVMIVLGLRIMMKSSKIKDEINQDPDKYFSQYETSRKNQDISSADIIDVEYTEKEVHPNE
ncbi:MAG: hypothetical protein IJO78_01140 [Erysipelotrichaceae bacterium]|jgi:nitrate/nitrite transporter NarK|nr:hypothetical protein [Erysipelotrichaceae bacterium]MBQ9840177.1 hypothetical protein [Erysipelotrichaceae bacterium]MBR5795463.1 hypothetical protein [Erysipelotrichaceae bacterium]